MISGGSFTARSLEWVVGSPEFLTCLFQSGTTVWRFFEELKQIASEGGFGGVSLRIASLLPGFREAISLYEGQKIQFCSPPNHLSSNT